MLITQPNKLRQKACSGQCAMGTAAFSFSPNVIEAMGYAGLDFVRIDTEHACGVTRPCRTWSAPR